LPFRFVPVLTQLPLQQSAFAEQTSVFCRQNETSAQTLFWQSAEQHSAFVVQPLPVRRQPPSDPHVPPLQIPLQHSDGCVQLPATGWSGTQGCGTQRPSVQEPEQQSLPTVHGRSTARQAGGTKASQVPEAPQLPVQHCSCAVQAPESAVQHCGYVHGGSGLPHVPLSQLPLQHSTAPPHVSPIGLQHVG
jgi:hypothetical protein